MSPVLIVAFALIFVALLLVFGAVGGFFQEKPGVNRSIAVLEALTQAPDEMKGELDASFSDRVLFPLLARTQSMGRRLTPEDASERIREKLELAGNPAGWTVERVMAGKVVGFAVALVVSLVLSLLMGLGFLPTLGFVVLASLAGYNAPNMYLYQQTYDRADKLQRALPDAIDLLDHLGRVGPGLRRRVRPGGAQHRRPPGRRVRPDAAGDADRARALRRTAVPRRPDQPA